MTEEKRSLKKGFALEFDKTPHGLRDMYGMSPFSVLDARQGEWQSRKRLWLKLGIQSEIGRGDNLLKFSKTAQLKKKRYATPFNDEKIEKDMDYYREKGKKGYGQCLQTNIGEKFGRKQTTGTSIFDPVLCELMYSWFCPIRGRILDPFCGGSVRGVIAGFFSYEYTGFDLRPEQIELNEYQLEQINRIRKIIPAPKWICDDTLNMDEHIKDEDFDFVFSCPPYGNLEIYSDDPRDLSNKEYETFLEGYDEIVLKACAHLRNNRFACFVVANFRDKKTSNYHDFVGDTIYSFEKAGLSFYNDIVLVTAVGTLPIRVTRQFKKYRKVGKTHQNILVFYKGDDHKKINDLEF